MGVLTFFYEGFRLWKLFCLFLFLHTIGLTHAVHYYQSTFTLKQKYSLSRGVRGQMLSPPRGYRRRYVLLKCTSTERGCLRCLSSGPVATHVAFAKS